MEEEEPNKKNKKAGGSKKKGTRDNLDQREKDMFWDIVRTRNAGMIWKILTESSSNQARHDAWVIVAQTFSSAISKKFTVDQAKQLFKRLKDKKKKDHDRQAVEREFRKNCSITGGGPSPMPPPDRDGDDYDEDLHDMMDPVATDYNSLVRPEHRIYGSSASARRPLGEIVIQNSENLPAFSQTFPDRTVETTSMEATSPTPSVTPPPPVSPFSRNLDHPGVRSLGNRYPPNNNNENVTSGSTFRTPATGTHQVLIQDGNGVSRTVVAEEPEDTPRLPKRKVKKTMNDAAVSYYTNMSNVQTALAKQRMKVLKRKENVEILRQMLLERALEKEGVEIPEFENIDSSESDSDEDIETEV